MQRLLTALFAVNLTVLVISVVGTAVVLTAGLPTWNYEPLAMALVFENLATCTAISVLLMSASQGWRRAVLLLAVCVVIAGGMEWLSMTTGFPFGATYEYTTMMGPRLAGRLPYIIPVAWFVMLYPSLEVAFSLHIPRWSAALVAAGMMTLWDVVLDPAMTNDPGLWAWHHEGGFYGVPPQNFLSWFVTTLLIVAVYFLLARGPVARSPATQGEGGWRPSRSRLPLLLYGSQSVFVAALAAMSGRGWAVLVWAAGFAMLIAAICWSGRKAAAIVAEQEALPQCSRASD